MIGLVTPLLCFGLLGAVVLAIVAIQRLIENRPAHRTSARDRLTRYNPWLAENDDLVWSAAARRVRLDRLTVLIVAVALILVTLRPTVAAAPTGDR